ncbi:MAG: SIS domain-containing protein [Chloroflexota bacterium]
MTTQILPPITALEPLPTEPRPGLLRALGQRAAIEGFAADVVRRGLRDVYLLGSGGGLLTHEGVQYLLERRATRFPTSALSANEFIYRDPARLGEGSLAVLASNTGTTPEVVEAARFAKQRGATVAAVTRYADTPLSQAADVAWSYDDETGVGDPKGIQLAILGLALLRESGDMDAAEHEAHIRTLEALPTALLDACRETEGLNATIAHELRDASIIYVIGAGPNHGTAYCLAMCYLQEMQWKDAASFDAAEFLHGAMEVVTEDTPVIQFLGEEATRPIDERAKAFLQRYTRKAFHIDSRDLALPGIAPDMRPFASHFALDAVMSRLAQHFEAATGHDLHNRRYMFKVPY